MDSAPALQARAGGVARGAVLVPLAVGVAYLLLRWLFPFSGLASAHLFAAVLAFGAGYLVARPHRQRPVGAAVVGALLALHGMAHWGYETNAAGETIQVPEPTRLLGKSAPSGPSVCLGSCSSTWSYAYDGNSTATQLLEQMAASSEGWRPRAGVVCDPNCYVVLERGPYGALLAARPLGAVLVLEVLVGPSAS